MIEPIRVLCVFSWLDRGGAEIACMNLYKKIDRDRIQFDFVKHTSRKCALEDEITSLGGRIFEAPRYLGYNHFAYCSWWKKHLERHPEHRIIHGHFFTISSVYFKVCKQMGCTTIAHAHAAGTEKRGAVKLFESFLKNRIVKYADYKLACGEKAGNYLYKKEKYEIIYNGIDTKKYDFSLTERQSIREELGIQDKFVVGTVGRQSQAKNPRGIVQLIELLSHRLDDFVFLWVGLDCMRGEIEKELRQHGGTDKIIMTGVRTDVERVLQAMDVFVMPSYFEGLPLAGVEAQLVGLPCLFSDVVTKEVVISEKCDFISIEDMEKWENRIWEWKDVMVNRANHIYDKDKFDIAYIRMKIEKLYMNIQKQMIEENDE